MAAILLIVVWCGVDCDPGGASRERSIDGLAAGSAMREWFNVLFGSNIFYAIFVFLSYRLS